MVPSIANEACDESHIEGTQSAQMKWLTWDERFRTEKPYQMFTDLPKDMPNSNMKFNKLHQTTIMDARRSMHDFTLDQHGFQWLSGKPSQIQRFDDGGEIESVYLKEVEDIIRNSLEGVMKVHIFDWRLRRNAPPRKAGEVLNLADKLQHLVPSTQVHVDTSPLGVIKRIQRTLSDEAPELLQKRVRVVNVWRPIHHTIEDWPLAVCDGSSVRQSDVIGCDHVTKQYKSETLYVLQNPEQKWYYLSNQTPDEILLLKNFDSAASAPAKNCPHTSFLQSGARLDALPRESIEVRVLVFSEA